METYRLRNLTGKILHIFIPDNFFIEVEPETEHELVQFTKVERIQTIIPVLTSKGETVQVPIWGNRVSLKSNGDIPTPNSKTVNIITEEMRDAFRKSGRDLKDCVVARRSSRGYYELDNANFIATLSNDSTTCATVEQIRKSMNAAWADINSDSVFYDDYGNHSSYR